MPVLTMSEAITCPQMTFYIHLDFYVSLLCSNHRDALFRCHYTVGTHPGELSPVSRATILCLARKGWKRWDGVEVWGKQSSSTDGVEVWGKEEAKLN